MHYMDVVPDSIACPLCDKFSHECGNEFMCDNGHRWRYCNAHEKPVKVVTSLINEDTSWIDYGKECCCHLDKLRNPHNDYYKEEPVLPKLTQPLNFKITLYTPEGVKTFNNRDTNDGMTPRNSGEINIIDTIAEQRQQMEQADFIRKAIQEQFGVTLDASITAATNTAKNPTPKNPPNHISKRAERLWPGFCKKYSSKWKDKDTVEDKWAVAVAIWRNYCIKRNVPPFDETPIDSDSVEYMSHRVEVARIKAAEAANSVTKAMLKKKFVSHVYRETVADIDTKRAGFYRILTTRKLKSDIDLKDQKFRNWLKAEKFNPTNGVFVRSISGLCSLVVGYDEEIGSLYLNTRYVFPSALVAMALGISQEDMKTKKSMVTKKLLVTFKKMMRETA